MITQTRVNVAAGTQVLVAGVTSYRPRLRSIVVTVSAAGYLRLESPAGTILAEWNLAAAGTLGIEWIEFDNQPIGPAGEAMVLRSDVTITGHATVQQVL